VGKFWRKALRYKGSSGKLFPEYYVQLRSITDAFAILQEFGTRFVDPCRFNH
jgi:hypothetical protein